MSNRSSRSTVSNPIICCFVTHWGSTTHGMRHPQHKKTVRTFRPLEHGWMDTGALQLVVPLDSKHDKVDEWKQEVMKDILRVRPIYALQGPPGTGKTTLV